MADELLELLEDVRAAGWRLVHDVAEVAAELEAELARWASSQRAALVALQELAQAAEQAGRAILQALAPSTEQLRRELEARLEASLQQLQAPASSSAYTWPAPRPARQLRRAARRTTSWRQRRGPYTLPRCPA
jgi:cell division septum initiation protein DivIVA